MNLKKLSLFLIIVCVLPLLLGATTAPNQVAWEDADYLVASPYLPIQLDVGQYVDATQSKPEPFCGRQEGGR